MTTKTTTTRERGDVRASARRVVIVLALVLGLPACGAKSGLELSEREASIDAARVLDASRDAAAAPDVPRDARTDVGLDAPFDGCLEQRFALTPVRPEIMFVVDRSTSMGWGLAGPDSPPPSRWAILVDALREQLPRYDERSDMGLTLFPAEGVDRCAVEADPRLPPAPWQASPILDVVLAGGPAGRTPTAAGLEAAERWFVSHPDISHVRAVVLATDGAPNCNGAIEPLRCPCTLGAGLPRGCPEAELCLDDVRTLAAIERLARREVPTYVIGIDGEPDPALSEVLQRMAIAGGRPNPRDPERAYYSVRRASDVASAFDRIQASIVSCSLTVELPERPEGRPVAVTLDGEVIPQDPSRTEGWEWSDERAQTLLLYGDACARAQDGEHALDFLVLC